jgi:hypothetical protein
MIGEARITKGNIDFFWLPKMAIITKTVKSRVARLPNKKDVDRPKNNKKKPIRYLFK